MFLIDLRFVLQVRGQSPLYVAILNVQSLLNATMSFGAVMLLVG